MVITVVGAANAITGIIEVSANGANVCILVLIVRLPFVPALAASVIPDEPSTLRRQTGSVPERRGKGMMQTQQVSTLSYSIYIKLDVSRPGCQSEKGVSRGPGTGP